MLNKLERFEMGDLSAETVKHSLGGERIIVLSALRDGDGQEVLFDEAEAYAFYAWLGRALQRPRMETAAKGEGSAHD